ncbi:MULTISPECIES: hypothetical protein [Pantoea]|jgi:hypothetical protein|uniref:hypothetical protein n=1 Tax=Pantoea TaxID=53335 RepID=UPI0011B6E239|nr:MULTISPECIES: hypothetical protein [Pantoea]MCD2357498.1 hypothetical protein [Pantoea sp. MHSD4]MDJ0472962.1 hypothetical protein [Pantoea eucalypti]
MSSYYEPYNSELTGKSRVKSARKPRDASLIRNYSDGKFMMIRELKVSMTGKKELCIYSVKILYANIPGTDLLLPF